MVYMNAKGNKEKRVLPRKKAQGSMEYIIILAVVIIGAILAGFFYLRSLSSTKIGNAESIVAAGSPGSKQLILALSEPLPKDASNVIIYIQEPVGITAEHFAFHYNVRYVNNYPEYEFLIVPGDKPITSDENVTGMSYSLNGQTISVATSTGQPIPIQALPHGLVLTP